MSLSAPNHNSISAGYVTLGAPSQRPPKRARWDSKQLALYTAIIQEESWIGKEDRYVQEQMEVGLSFAIVSQHSNCVLVSAKVARLQGLITPGSDQ